MPILDTDVIIALTKGDAAAVECFRNLEANPTLRKLTTSITTFELFIGAFKLLTRYNERKNIELVKELLSNIDEVLQFDQESSEIAGRIIAELTAKGTFIELPDIMIAAMAIKRNEPVITRNVKHFSRIEGLIVQPW